MWNLIFLEVFEMFEFEVNIRFQKLISNKIRTVLEVQLSVRKFDMRSRPIPIHNNIIIVFAGDDGIGPGRPTI